MSWRSTILTQGLPRARGDGPGARRQAGIALAIAARAGMDPVFILVDIKQSRLPRTGGDGPGRPTVTQRNLAIAPHARGWPVAPESVLSTANDCPARAGMAPGDQQCLNEIWRLPPRAGMDRPASRRRATPFRLPRTRGHGPKFLVIALGRLSPPMRGWTSTERCERGIRKCTPRARG